MRFAERLRQLRDDAGLSEAKLAEKSGVSFGAIHNYGLGIRQPTFTAVVKIARALGVTCEVFADCEDVIGVGGSSLASEPTEGTAEEKPAEGQDAEPKPKRRRKKKGDGQG